MTYEVQQTRWDRLIRRASGSIGPGSRVSETISELFPVVDVERVPSELLILAGTRLAWQSTQRPADAGNVTASQLQNPVDSGSIITVTQLIARVGLATFLQAEITETFIGTPVPGLFRDGRLGIARETTGKVASADGVATGGGLRVFLQANINTIFPEANDIVTLGPGQALQIGSVIVNVEMTMNYLWREREALPSELQF